jgi:hypothetical protein
MRKTLVTALLLLSIAASDGLHKYRVRYQLEGKTYAEEISAGCQDDAKKVITQRNPKAVILDASEVKDK